MTKNKKQKTLLNTAKDLFYKHGFKRVNVEEICKIANVSKMTFYKYYSNKIELAKAVYCDVVDDGLLKFHNVLLEESTTEDKIKKLLLLKLENTNDISADFLQDFYTDTELGLKEFIHAKNQESWKLIIADFELAQEEGWFRKDFNPILILLISQKLPELVNDSNALKLYKSPQELIMAITDFSMYGLIPHK